MAREGVNEDLEALGTLGLIVDVVKGTRQAVVENSRLTQSQSAVTAQTPARSELVTGLRWSIELELTVGRNVTGTSLGIEKETVLESQGDGRTARSRLALLKQTNVSNRRL